MKFWGWRSKEAPQNIWQFLQYSALAVAQIHLKTRPKTWQIIKKHENGGPETTQSTLCTRGCQKTGAPQVTWRFWGPFGLPFGSHFRRKTCFFRHRFFDAFLGGILMDLGGCWSSFWMVLGCQTVPKTAKAKIWKTYVFLSKIDVFKVSDHPKRHEHL